MSEIVSYTVVEPPTSGELEERAVTALLGKGVLSVVLRSHQEVPAVEDQEFSFRIRQTTHPLEGGMFIAGELEGDTIGETIIVRTNSNPAEAALASMVL